MLAASRRSQTGEYTLLRRSPGARAPEPDISHRRPGTRQQARQRVSSEAGRECTGRSLCTVGRPGSCAPGGQPGERPARLLRARSQPCQPQGKESGAAGCRKLRPPLQTSEAEGSPHTLPEQLPQEVAVCLDSSSKVKTSLHKHRVRDCWLGRGLGKGPAVWGYLVTLFLTGKFFGAKSIHVFSRYSLCPCHTVWEWGHSSEQTCLPPALGVSSGLGPLPGSAPPQGPLYPHFAALPLGSGRFGKETAAPTQRASHQEE